MKDCFPLAHLSQELSHQSSLGLTDYETSMKMTSKCNVSQTYSSSKQISHMKIISVEFTQLVYCH